MTSIFRIHVFFLYGKFGSCGEFNFRWIVFAFIRMDGRFTVVLCIHRLGVCVCGFFLFVSMRLLLVVGYRSIYFVLLFVLFFRWKCVKADGKCSNGYKLVVDISFFFRILFSCLFNYCVSWYFLGWNFVNENFVLISTRTKHR